MKIETDLSKRKMSDIRKVWIFFILTITVTWKMEGMTELRTWLRQTFRWRIRVIWYLLAAFLLPIGMAMLHIGLYRLLGGQTHFSNVLQWLFYPISLVIVVLIFGGQEEPGWRGFAVPKLLTKYNPIVTSFIIAPVWVVWHLPLYFTPGWSGAEQPLIWFLLYVLGLSLIMTWLYLKSNKSVLPVMLLHGASNQVFNYFPMETVVIRSLGYDFNVLKTIVYWTIALILLIVTTGQLGWRSDKTAGVSEAAIN
jgi:membrane protease YdiL (CAAX protease family)